VAGRARRRRLRPRVPAPRGQGAEAFLDAFGADVLPELR
jgi:hypothetical protein